MDNVRFKVVQAQMDMKLSWLNHQYKRPCSNLLLWSKVNVKNFSYDIQGAFQKQNIQSQSIESCSVLHVHQFKSLHFQMLDQFWMLLQASCIWRSQVSSNLEPSMPNWQSKVMAITYTDSISKLATVWQGTKTETGTRPVSWRPDLTEPPKKF